jgi:hypothetical protein
MWLKWKTKNERTKNKRRKNKKEEREKLWKEFDQKAEPETINWVK